MARTSLIWKNVIPSHHWAQFNRDWHAGKPADYKSGEEDQQEADEDEDDQVTEEVDPADAAPEGCASDDSGIAGAA
eukprot:6217163-Pyramimonas_sp.AAC.1